MKLVLGSFWDRSLRIRAQYSDMKNGESNLADQNSKSYLIRITFGIPEFSEALITNRS